MSNEQTDLFADELDLLLKKYFDRNLTHHEFMIVLACAYKKILESVEKDITNESDIIEIRDQAMELVSRLVYGDGLLDDEGSTH